MPNSPINELQTVRDWIRWGASQFNSAQLWFGHGTDNAWDEAMVLVLWVINQPWEWLERVYETRLTMDERQKILDAIHRRIDEKIPAAYITGEAWFGGLKFEVNQDVLVPRSPIAELVEENFSPWLGSSPGHVLDLCTGSGCIGILCAEVFEDARVDLSDISPAALAVARRNVARYQLEERVRVIESNLFCSDAFQGQKYDLIVSNPPYVDAQDLAAMPAEYRAEPPLGLASGADGLDITRRILREAHRYLTPEGLLVVEVGNSWESLEKAYPDVPFFWPEFENGGHGVFILTAEQLEECASVFTGH